MAVRFCHWAGWFFLLALCLGCKREVKAPPDTLWLVMQNQTEQHLTNFVLDYGSGKFQYEIFSRGYTFAGWAKVLANQKISGQYYDEAGKVHEFKLERELTRDMVGGSFYATFKPNDKIDLSMNWP